MLFYPSHHDPSPISLGPEAARLQLFVETTDQWQAMVATLEQGLSCPVSVWWPKPFQRPLIMESPSYRAAKLPRQSFPVLPEVFSLGHGLASPILFTKGIEPDNPWLSHALHALKARWLAREQALQETLTHLWNNIWLHFHQGHDRSEDIFDLLIQSAYKLSGASVIYVAARRDSGDSIQTVKNQGILNPDFGFRLKVGYGVGGYVTQTQHSVMIPDYRCSPLRDTTVTALIDDEGILSGTIVPWCIPNGLDGVLYVTHRQPEEISPSDASILQQFVRALGPVYLSALDSRHRKVQFLKTDSLQVSAILIQLRKARQQQSFEIFSEVTQSLQLPLTIADEWNQTIFQSYDTPSTRPNLQIRLGIDPYWGRMSLWNMDTASIFPGVWPDVLETAAWLFARSQAKEWEKIFHQSQWFRTMLASDAHNAKTLWEHRDSYHFAPQFRQIVGFRCLGTTTVWPQNTILDMKRYLEGRFGAMLFLDNCWIWALIPKDYADDTWYQLWNHLFHEHSLPCFISAVRGTLEGSTIQAMVSQIRETHATVQVASASGGYFTTHANNFVTLLANIDSQHLDSLAQHWLGPLLVHESAKDLVNTLYHYLATGSISDTAEKLFLHQNSVRYRISKICGLLGLDNLENVFVRENLWIASRIWIQRH